MNRILAFVLVALAVSGCGGSESPLAPQPPIDVTATIAYGQTGAIGDATGLSVRFDAVTEDSRCPINATCISAGRAVVRVTVSGSAAPETADLASDPVNARSASAQGVRIEWQQLEPYPWAGRPTPPHDYRLTVRVVR